METSTAYAVHKLAVEMDRAADRLLQERLGISYGRFYFLLVLVESGQVPQHSIATTMGYSAPAISNMAGELVKDGLVEAISDPAHGRRRLITITPKGNRLLSQSLELLDECFSELTTLAGIDEVQYKADTEQLIMALVRKRRR